NAAGASDAEVALDAAPALASVVPGAGAVDVDPGVTPVLTFTEPVTAQPGAVSIECDGVSQPATVDAGPAATLEVQLSAALPAGAVSGGFNVLGNDELTAGATIAAFDAVTERGGAVTMVTAGPDAGTFVYDPPRGFEGEDSFEYTLADGAATASATVRLTVSGVIWFIDNDPAACASACDGRPRHPYPALGAF